MEPSGANRIHDFMSDRMESGFASLEEVADTIAGVQPAPAPANRSGRTSDQTCAAARAAGIGIGIPKFISGTSALPPIEVTEVDRMHTAVEAILRSGVPMLLVRGQMSDLVTQERADEFIARFPEIDFVDVGGAGHMVAGDRNDIFAGAVVEFLARHSEDR